MLMDVLASIGAFVSENYAVGMVIGLILLVVFEIAQYIVNSSLEEDLIDLAERLEAVEKMVGIEENEDCEKEEK